METTVKERLIRFIKSIRFTQKEFCDSIGVCRSYVSTIRQSLAPEKLSAISAQYPELNIEWLLTGKGEMLNSGRAVSGSVVVTNNGHINGNNNMNVTHTHNSSAEPSDDDVPMSEVEELPIIPSKIVNEPAIDVYNYINENNTDTTPKVPQLPKASAGYKIKSRAMEPDIYPGDMLFLEPYPVGEEHIVPGDPYVVDTSTNGLVTRYLFYADDGFLAVSKNPDRYPNFVIKREHINTISRIVGLLRLNV